MTSQVSFIRLTIQFTIGILLLLTATSAMSAPARTAVFISDLHMGLGKDSEGNWYPTEDFRWPAALEGFLDHISQVGNDAVDLVIVGDFLELWQPPSGITCEGPNADYGCSLKEMSVIVDTVIKAHTREFAALSRFARKGSNCIHLVPGNHDAALVIDDIWDRVADALESDKSCIQRVETGTWVSEDGRIVAEHGHQIGWDPNRYQKWPMVSKEVDGVRYLQRPWGEYFVQSIFNDAEASYPLIDNLSPLSAGTKYQIADQSFTATAEDLSMLIKFNLLETSLTQKITVLGEREKGGPPRWDVEGARALGSALFAGALAKDDPWAALLSPSEITKFTKSLVQLAQDRRELPDEAVLALCDQIAVRKSEPQCPTVDPKTLGSFIETLVVPRKRVVGPYVEKKWEEFNQMRVFVYGHTHSFEREWPVEISSRVKVSVFNDGAFQRIFDDEKFRRIVKAKDIKSPGEGLRVIEFENLPACYTYVSVMVSPTGDVKEELKAWFMEEGSVGKPIDVCNSRCADVGQGCD